jgi:hypothetical protein
MDVNELLASVHLWAVRTYRRARRSAPSSHSRISQVVSVPSRAGLPKRLNPQRLYVLGGTVPKWAVFDCACGRGHTIELNLANPSRSRWKVTTSAAGFPSIHPSIDFQSEPRCHYWLRNGRVYWTRN